MTVLEGDCSFVEEVAQVVYVVVLSREQVEMLVETEYLIEFEVRAEGSEKPVVLCEQQWKGQLGSLIVGCIKMNVVL
jgi:hypothetical protein